MLHFFDNEQESFLESLRKSIEAANQADFCVGYFTLGGWNLIDDLIELLTYRSEGQCRLLIGRCGIGNKHQNVVFDDICNKMIEGLKPGEESTNSLDKFGELLKKKTYC